jgi:hypothetical protein
LPLPKTASILECLGTQMVVGARPHGGKWLRPALRLGPAMFRSVSLGRGAFR